MSESIVIFYFSGTGNTEVVASLLESEFKKNFVDINVDVVRIEDVLKKNLLPSMDKYDLVGVGFPIYAFNAPGIIYDFIKAMPSAVNKKTFVFETCSDPCFLNDAAGLRVKKKLGEKGYCVFHESLIPVASNWAMGYDDELVKQLYNTAVKKAVRITREILSGKERIKKPGVISRLITFACRIEALSAPLTAKDFTVSESCIHCNKCVEDCPTNNIFLEGDKIKFAGKCIICMRCIYRCPMKAISPRLYKFMVLKNGYDIKRIINDSGIKGVYVTDKTRGWFRHFYDYIYKD